MADFTEDQFRAALDHFLASVQRLVDEYYARSLPTLTPHKIGAEVGRRYVRIYKVDSPGNRSAYAFVDMTNGDILKSASWKSPVPGARGNIFDEASWKEWLTPYGTARARECIGLAEAPDAVDPDTAMIYEGAEKWYAQIGERHGYGGLVNGIAYWVKQKTGVDVDPKELPVGFHDPLAGFADPEHTIFRGTAQQIARAVHEIFARSVRTPESFPYEIRSILADRGIGDPSPRWHQAVVDTEAAVTGELKGQKVRRGTKRYAQLVAEGAEKVHEYLIGRLRAMRDSWAASTLPRARKDADKALEQIRRTANWVASRDEMRRALDAAARLPPDPETDKNAAARLDDLARAANMVAGRLQALEQTADEDPGDMATELMARSATLAPFAKMLEGAGRTDDEHEAAEWTARETAHAGRHIDRNEAIVAIKAALKKRSGKTWSVKGGRGTAWGWITITALPARLGDGGSMSDEDRVELGKLLGLEGPAEMYGESVAAGSDYRAEYVDRAEGRAPEVIGQPYWD